MITSGATNEKYFEEDSYTYLHNDFSQFKIINAPCSKRDKHIYPKTCTISRHYKFGNPAADFGHPQGGVQQGNPGYILITCFV